MKKFIVLFVLMIGNSTFAGGGSSIGVGSPASVNCAKLGGAFELESTELGDRGLCVIEEWSLFHQMLERGLTIEHQYDGISMPNPASVNCNDVEGTLRIEENEAGQFGLCVVDEWHLYEIINVLND